MTTRALAVALFLLSCSKNPPPPPRERGILEVDPKGKPFTVRYPEGYDVRQVGDESAIVFGTGEAGSSERSVVSFITVRDPLSVNVLAAHLVTTASEHYDEWKEVSRAPAKCHGSDGLRVEATYRHDGSRRMIGCVFMRGGRGYFFKMDFLDERRGSDEPALRKIIDATEFAH